MKKKYFGTDGIRGSFGEFPITLSFLENLANSIKKTNKNIKKVIIGKDTRESCDLIENAIALGFKKNNVEIDSCGIVSTPILSFNTRSFGYDLGIMISASHNPFKDNGVKIFNRNGEKLTDIEEIEIEKNINLSELNNFDETKLTQKILVKKYIDYENNMLNRFSKLSDFHQEMVVDFANGSLSYIGPRILEKLNLVFKKYSCQPSGKNINKDCGAMNPDFLIQKTLHNKAKLGLSFDGDADRVMFCDEKGKIVDGDFVLAILAIFLQKSNSLKNNLIVSTQMSNLGFRNFLKKKKINFILSNVGDRYVIEEMKKNNCLIGGEPSGHIIFSENSYCGDGIYTALLLMEILHEEKCTLKEMCDDLFVKVPQKLINLELKRNPEDILKDPQLNNFLNNIYNEKKYDIVLRKSGTENLLRLMVQAKSKNIVDRLIREILSIIKELDEQ